MYRASDLKSGWLNIWGWRQNYNVSDFTISESLTVTETGQYYQEVHPLLTLDNIKALAPDFENIVYPAWVITTQYRVGDRVASGGSDYRARVDNIGKTPATNPTEWDVFDSFSLWLEEKTQAGVVKAARSFWDAKMSRGTAKNILESKALFNGAGRIQDLIAVGTKLVAFELVPVRSDGVTVKIDKIGLQFTEAGEMTLYLMHSSRDIPVQEITLTRTRTGGMEWFTPSTDIFLPYISDENDAGGSWYLAYKQEDLPGTSQAVNKDKDWSAKPCTSCSPTELANWNVWSRYLEVHPFSVSEVSDPLTLWDIEDNKYDYNTNYGMNLQITIECDVTDIMLDQKLAFQNIIGLQVAVDMLREMAYNPVFKVGRPQQQLSKETILYALDGDSRSPKKSGLVYDLAQAMKAVSLDTSSMSRVCFPCNNKGLKYRTV
jgi:hypothetical protein